MFTQQSSCIRGADVRRLSVRRLSVRRLSINSIFSKTAARTQAKFDDKLPTHHVGKLLFLFSKFSPFLALLDCVSRANTVAQASVVRRLSSGVRNTRFLRNRQEN